MKTQMFALTVVSAVCLAAGTASAQTQAPSAEWQARVQTLEEQVKQLKAELDALRGQMGAAPAAQQPTAVRSGRSCSAAAHPAGFWPRLPGHFRSTGPRRRAARSSTRTSA